MTDETTTKAGTPTVDPVTAKLTTRVADLEQKLTFAASASNEFAARVTALEKIAGTVPAEFAADFKELETVVHTIAPFSRNAEHSVVVTWLEKIGARIKKAVEG